MEDKNYYVILGIDGNASLEDITRAYRRRALERHPDHHPEDPTAELDMKLIVEAAETLRDPLKRKAYDHYIKHMRNGQCASYDFVSHRAAEERDGYDTTYEVVVSSEEALRGAIRVLTFHRADGRRDDVTTHIPPGAYDGMAVRHPGKGGPSRDGQHHGELIVVVRIH